MDERPNDYDTFAEAYAAVNEDNLVNAFYERPAMLSLAGDVTNRHVLDAGCGAGPLAAALIERGAVVTGVDASSQMLGLAERRLGAGVRLQQLDLRDPLPFATATFDDVVASLVLHYLEDWGPTLAEFHRILKPGGRLLASVDHPIVAYLHDDPLPDYFAVGTYSFDWPFDGRSVPMTFWRRPLHAMTDAFSDAGFRLTKMAEPQPDPAAQERFPEDFAVFSTQPGFLFFVLTADTPGMRSTFTAG
jgi:SAM-dependent methyltransferase